VPSKPLRKETFKLGGLTIEQVGERRELAIDC